MVTIMKPPSTFKSYTYAKNDINFKILAAGISRTNIKRYIAKIPKKYFKGLNKIYMLRVTEEKMYEIVSRSHHPWETDFNRSYHAVFYVDEGDVPNIVFYITDDFYKTLNNEPNLVFLVRTVILHELGHFLIYKKGIYEDFTEQEHEYIAERFVELNSDVHGLTILMPVSLKRKRELDKVLRDL